jgi:hypothetical protein
MIKAAALFIVALAGAWTPLNAQVFNLSINGTVTGFQSTVMCGLGSTPTCFTTYPGGVVTEDFVKAFDLQLYPSQLPEGDAAFSWGDPRSSGLWAGTITNSGGFLTGHDLSFSYETASCRAGGPGCQFAFATASTFNVLGGIPEPGTWATMLLGFLGIGLAMRRIPRGISTQTALVRRGFSVARPDLDH